MKTFDRHIQPGSPFPNPVPVEAGFSRPVLCVVVDAEEDFGWDVPLSPLNTDVASVRSQHLAQDVFSRFGVRPTYLVTYPMAVDPLSVGVLREFLHDDACEVGTHLHPWVTPPGIRGFDRRLSFPGNLPEVEEHEKLHRLTGTVGDTFGIQPVTYKAGRYGFGPQTAGLLEREGYLIDTSLMPRTSYAGDGGPDFQAFDCGPFWFGSDRRLLELPVTRALTGPIGRSFPEIYRYFDGPLARHKQIDGREPGRGPISVRSVVGSLLARSRLMERISLSPEGSDLPAMRRLTRTLLRRGQRIFMLQYHSPSLTPGNTPYVRTARDLDVFLDTLAGFLSFFRDEVGGQFMTPRALRERLVAAPAEPEAKRCLIVANTFSPVHGGSAVVYSTLARLSGGRVSVLAPKMDYRDGAPIPGVAEFDAAAPFRVHRVRRLRTQLPQEALGATARFRTMLHDITLRWRIFWKIRRIIRAENIGVLCIGELVSSGWLALAARPLLGVPCVFYVHGEEITINDGYDIDGRRRRRTLAAADGIVAVSRFTRDHLVNAFGVPPEKISLINNGVDTTRFTPRPKRADLLRRYGLEDSQVLLTVGRLYARKGMDRVIQALTELRRLHPSIRYLIVGDGAYRETLERMAVEHGVADIVVFTGAVTDAELADHYALGDVFIMANRTMPDGDTEGFGLVFLEANAAGLPVIAGRDGGSADAVTDGVNGLVVDGNAPSAIAAAVSRLLSDDALRTEIATRGLVVARDASWQLRVDRFLAYCDRLIT